MEQQGMSMTEKRILATFQPQAWQRDYAVDIDGRCEVDVTDKVLSLALDEIIGLDDDDYDTDDLVDLRVLVPSHGHQWRIRSRTGRRGARPA